MHLKRYCLTILAGIAMGGVFQTSEAAVPDGVAAPGQKYVAAPAGDRIPGSYVVVLSEDAGVHLERRADDLRPAAGRGGASAADVARDLALQHGAKVRHIYRSALAGFAADMNEARARALSNDRRVAAVYEDVTVHVDAIQAGPTWGLDRVDQRNLPLDSIYSYADGAGGAGVRAYVIDSGIRTTHTQFGGRASAGYGVNYDCFGHGTHVAGTIGGSTYGVAKGVQLVSVQVLDCMGNASMSSVAAAVDWVTANAVRPAVANMSLGGPYYLPVNQAVQNSIASGIVYVLAAGNFNSAACAISPASTPEAITVGATDSSDQRAGFSNYGSCLDLFAPGVDITSSYSAFWGDDNTTALMSGTSMASPHVAGAVAVYLSMFPSATPAQVHDHFKIGRGSTVGLVGNPGAGSPNLLLHARSMRKLASNATGNAASGYIPGWSPDNAYDGVPGSVYSSYNHGTPYATEWIAGWLLARSPAYAVSELRLLPRQAPVPSFCPLAFPALYSLYLTNTANTAWNFLGTYTTQANCVPGDTVVIPVPPNLGVTWGVHMVAQQLNTDGYTYYFQIADVEAYE
jgi:subtilisin family serine protease